MSIRSELLNIQHSDPQNILHAADAVRWAADNPESDLHRSLEWDNQKAADEHRLSQVRHLIQLHVVLEDGGPVLVSLSVDRVRGGGYRSIDEVLPVQDLRDIMLADALAELERVRRKYERVVELTEVWIAAEAVRNAPQPRQRRGARQSVPA